MIDFKTYFLAENRNQVLTPEFQKWFAGSKVVDSEGRPLRVYHGRAMSKTGDKFFNNYVNYFTDEPNYASEIAKNTHEYIRKVNSDELAAGRVIPVYLRITNPVPQNLLPEGKSSYLQYHDNLPQLIKKWEKMGYDGIIGFSDTPSADREFVVFHSHQIKSATGNKGTFDSSSSDIRH